MKLRQWSLRGLALSLVLSLELIPAAVSAKPPATTCKPCGDPPLTASIEQADTIVLGRVTRSLDPPPKAGEPGEATLWLAVQKWLRKPSQRPLSSLPKTKGLTQLKVHFAWDGACSAPPPALKRDQKVVLFLVPSETPDLWEGSLSHCSLTHMLPSDREFTSLKRRLTNGGRVD